MPETEVSAPTFGVFAVCDDDDAFRPFTTTTNYDEALRIANYQTQLLRRLFVVCQVPA